MKLQAAKVRNYLLRASTLFVMLGLALFSSSIYGQGTGSGQILGTITDPSGAVVSGANVTITNADTGIVRTTVSNAAGTFSAPDLPAGHYNVRIEAQGFKIYEQKNIALDIASVIHVNSALQVGAATQTVTVEAAALQVQADTTDVSETINSTQVQNLPTNGRNMKQLEALVPGANNEMPDFDSPGAQFQSTSIYFNGMRSEDNNWQIDGAEAYDRGGGGIFVVAPSQNAISEFTIQTEDYAADEGESSGAMASVDLKSGTKQFHGSAWEFDRNDDLDAKEYFQTTKAELRYNAFGFNVGGPVQFKSPNPKTFFFYNQEWRREINGGSIHNLAFTSAELGGNIAPLGKIYVPMTTDPNAIAKFGNVGLKPGQEFPNDTIPSSLIDANAAAYIKAGYLLPPNSGSYYSSTANTSTDFREEIARVDHQFSPKLSLMSHLIWDSLSQAAPTVAWSGNTFPTIGSLETVPSWQGVVRLTYTIKPNLLNEATYGENGNQIVLANTGLFTAPSGFNVAEFFPSANPNNKIPDINISGGPIGETMDSSNWPWLNFWKSNTIKDDVSWITGAHNFKFGFGYMWSNKTQELFDNIAGTFNFRGQATGCAVSSDPAYCPANTSGIGLADFLLGDAQSYSQPEIQDYVSIEEISPDAYAMDTWRVNKRLTLNLGLRWEAMPHAYDQNGRASNFYPNLWNPADTVGLFQPGTSGAMNTSSPGFTTVSGVKLSTVPFYMNGIGIAGRNGIPKGLVDNHWDIFGPRVGFDYDLFGGGRTILRGGVGIFYTRNQGNEEYNMGTNVPFVNQTGTTNPYLDTPGTSWQNGVSAGKSPTTPQGFTALQQRYPITTIYEFNLGIQHQLGNNMVATIAFVGNSNAHLADGVATNTLLPSDIADRTNVCGSPCGGAAGGVDADYYRQFLGFSGITTVMDEVNSHYESLQATLRGNSWKGLTFGSAYTYSHAFDVEDAQIFASIDDPFNPNYSRGTSGFDRRQIFVGSASYDLPIFAHSNGLANHLAGGWTLAAIMNFQSGTPSTITAPDWLGFGGGTNNHANFSGKVSYPHSVGQYFSTTGFSQPAALTWGTAPKSLVVGPGEDHWTASLYKMFRFTERANLQFRADAFNTWNHSTFNSLNTSVLTGNAGSPINQFAGNLNNTGDPREFQFGATVSF